MPKGNKTKRKNEIIPRRLVDDVGRIANAQEERKNIEQQQERKSMGLWEQRGWQILSAIIILGVGGSIATGVLQLGPAFQSQNDYDINITVNPSRVILNNNNDIQFQFSFINTGKKQLNDLTVYRIELYREADNQIDWLFDSFNNRADLNCKTAGGSYYSTYSTFVFSPGDNCTFSLKTGPHARMFDDKDKSVKMLVYFKTIPPLENKAIKLDIY